MKNKTFNTDFKPDIEFARFVRKKRSEIKAELKSGRLTLKELISNKEKYEKYIINLKVLELDLLDARIWRCQSRKSPEGTTYKQM